MSFEYLTYDDDEIQGCIMLVPNDENFEEIQKPTNKKKMVSPERPESKKTNIRANQFRSPVQKVVHKEDEDENKIVNNFTNMLSKLDNDSAITLLEALKKDLKGKKKN